MLIDFTRNKIDPIYRGPYIVTKIEDRNIEVKDVNTNKVKTVHKDNVRKYMK